MYLFIYLFIYVFMYLFIYLFIYFWYLSPWFGRYQVNTEIH